MNAFLSRMSSILVTLLILVVLLISTGSTPGRVFASLNDEESSPDSVAPGALPIQGKLTDAGGAMLNGTYNISFRLYDVATGGTALCGDTVAVTVTNGLFNTYMDHCYGGILTGQKVWLGIQVEGDAEMSPRQVIFPVALPWDWCPA